jgi:hypothetical protein
VTNVTATRSGGGTVGPSGGGSAAASNHQPEGVLVRSKAILAATLLAASGALVASGVAGAGGGGGATTKVKIRAPGGSVFGTVESSKPNRCANGRTVKVFREKGGEQGGGDDIKVGSDTASPNAGEYQWNLGNPGLTGRKIYARAGRIPGCKPDNSRTVVAG